MKKRKYYYSLQALRGLMALLIVMGHSILLFKIGGIDNINELEFYNLPKNQAILAKILRIFFNGSVAVSFFFVLSGFLLAYSFSTKRMNFKIIKLFYIKRLLRIYPVYIFSLIITAIFMINFYHYQTYSVTTKWFKYWFQFKPSSKLIFKNILFRDTSMNSVWALKPILSFYLISPVFYFLNKKQSKKIDLFILLILIVLAFFTNRYNAVKYTFVFYIGFLLPKWNTYLKKVVKNNRLNINYVGFVFSVFLFTTRILFLKHEILIKLSEGILIFFIIFLTINYKMFFINNLTKNKLVMFYGKISYSFYLINFLILYATAYLFLNMGGESYLKFNPLIINLSLGFLSIIISTPAAYFIYIFIEKNPYS